MICGPNDVLWAFSANPLQWATPATYSPNGYGAALAYFDRIRNSMKIQNTLV